MPRTLAYVKDVRAGTLVFRDHSSSGNALAVEFLRKCGTAPIFGTARVLRAFFVTSGSVGGSGAASDGVNAAKLHTNQS